MADGSRFVIRSVYYNGRKLYNLSQLRAQAAQAHDERS